MFKRCSIDFVDTILTLLMALSNCCTSFFVKIIGETEESKEKKERELIEKNLLLFRLTEFIDNVLRLSSIASNANLESIDKNLLSFLVCFSNIVVKRCL